MKYPDVLATYEPSKVTVNLVNAHPSIRRYAEFGVYQAKTACAVAPILAARGGSLDVFDFEARATEAVKAIRSTCPDVFVAGHANTMRTMDSYCWSLMKLLGGAEMAAEKVACEGRGARREWDYVFIDGPHSWAVDGFAFLLCDRLLRSGGLVELDDVFWTFKASPTLNPKVFPETADLYTEEQMQIPQVKKIIDLLVLPMGYEEVVRNRVYRKP
jgi:hypothetical protein